MEIPKKIKICGITYDVVIKKMENPDNYGMHVQKDCVIYLNKDSVNRQIIEETFIHEILHAISKITETEFEENQIKSLARLLYQVLKDNNLLKE